MKLCHNSSIGPLIIYFVLELITDKARNLFISRSCSRPAGSENHSGWMAKEVMNLIYKRTGVKYHEVHIYRLLHKWDFSLKVPRMKFVNVASKQDKNKFRKRQEG